MPEQVVREPPARPITRFRRQDYTQFLPGQSAFGFPGRDSARLGAPARQSVQPIWKRIREGTDLSGLGIVQRIIWTGRLAEDLLDTAARALGFRSRGDYEVAATIRRSEPALLTSSDLADQLLISPSGVTGRLDRLEHDGLIVRSRHRTDRRFVEVELTKAGRRAIDKAFETNLLIYDLIASGLSCEDQEGLTQSLGEVLNKLETISTAEIKAVTRAVD